ncbi:MAG: hypothetical protein ACUVUG_07985, partial [Candidatus Aminicenantia bacterium]
KFSGVTGYLITCGYIKEYLQNVEIYFSWLGTNPNYSVSSDFRFSHPSFELSLEGKYLLSRRNGVFFGVESIEKNWKSSSRIIYNHGEELGVDDLLYSLKTSIKVISVTIGFSYSIVKSSGFNLDFKSGANYYFGNVKFNETSDYIFASQNKYHYILDSEFQAEPKKIGYTAGFELEQKLFWKVRFSLDIFYRMVNFKEIKGDYSWRERTPEGEISGTKKNLTLWYGSYEAEGVSYKRSEFYETKPGWLTDARPFEIGLDGFIIKAGIKILF